jgi:hypothetical protein
MYGYGYSLYNRTPFLGTSGVDPAAQAYFAATGITGVTQQAAINNLVTGLKADGIWSKMKAVYPFVTDNRNLLGYTEDFSNAYWTKTNVTVTSNSAVAPNGTTTADTLTPTAGTNVDTPCVFNALSSTVETRTISFYAKSNGYDYAYARVGGNTPTPVSVFLLTGSGSVLTNQNNLGSTITSVGNGWYRCTMTYSHGAFFFAPNIGCCSSTYTVTSSQVLTTTNGTSGIFIWGAQLDSGSTATTYQPIATTQQAYIASQFKYNLVNPIDSDAAYRLVFNGGWTHSSNGATPNGTNGYANTKVFNNTNLTDRASHWSAYLRTINANDGYFGYFNNFNVFGLQQRNNLNRLLLGVNSILTTVINSTNGYLIGKTDSALGKVYVNNTQSETQVANVISGNLEFFLGGLNNNGSGAFLYSQHQYAFSTLGDKLSDTEASNLYTRVQAFQTALSRQV